MQPYYFLGYSAQNSQLSLFQSFLFYFHKVELTAVLESQGNIYKSPLTVTISLFLPCSAQSHSPHCAMRSSNFFTFLLVMALLVPHERTAAEDDSSGFRGYERDALLALKEGFNSSFLNRNWTGIMCYMNEAPYWHGIQCVNGRVTGIILESMGISGEIKTDALANLTELSLLSFKNNSVSGNLMDFANNPKLRKIDLSDNKFQDQIPSSLLYLHSLESLLLQENNLTGPIPGFNQSSLKTFNVSQNNLSGPIPETKTLQSFGLSSYLGNEKLCGPPTRSLCNTTIALSQSKSENLGIKSDGPPFGTILVVVNVIVLVVLMFLFIIYYKKYKKLKAEMKAKNLLPKDEEHDSTIVDRAMEKRNREIEMGKLIFVENNGPRFELDDLLKASAEGLGHGNFGNCYKAMLDVGPVVVVKRLKDLKPLSSEEFTRQIRAIADQKHPNLMPLLGYFYSKDEKLFLYRFAAHGNIYNRLHGGRGTRNRVPFRWSSRLAVARGVARALEHLHLSTRSQTTAPHGNLKSSNVLLDENDEVLVTDYGLSSLIALPIAAQRMVSFKTPEYQSHKRISKKSDVWSYGSLLLELLTGRIPAHSAPPGTNGVDLSGWVHRAVREEWTAEIFDPEIAVQRGANQGMLRLMKIAMRCCEKSPEKRPEISQVVAEVEEVKVAVDSEDEEFSYSSLDPSVTDESLSATASAAIADDRR
ncbi:probable inactive receptor kinase At2g26730 [Sesamum indicum]|uniref:Probable inactive receptor kinase At2g26730 n=1 Tax=Sesamum indicum TaxID=4182 RepID=A0A6I9TQ98_SESIN|nr:probable inactive receptor kinase At2g26730 [Sesamum indicum]